MPEMLITSHKPENYLSNVVLLCFGRCINGEKWHFVKDCSLLKCKWDFGHCGKSVKRIDSQAWTTMNVTAGSRVHCELQV